MLNLLTLLAPLMPSPQLAPPPPGPPPPPPLPMSEQSPQSHQRLVSFTPGSISCGDTVIRPTLTEPPMSAAGYDYGPQASGPRDPYVLSFSIDATGRPIDIRQAAPVQPGWIDISDVAPAFATWRFAAGTPRTGCFVQFTIDDRPISAAPMDQAARYYALPHNGDPFPYEVFRRTQPVDSTCFDPYFPPELVRVFPDFDKIPQRPGTRAYALIGFDVGASGKPTNVHVAASDGNAVLDRQSIDAVKRSRFVAGARTGCTYPFRRTATVPTPAPPMPPVADFRPTDAVCDGQSGWAQMPALIYPDNFRQRSIEGWAIVRYDVAPWGETGNVTVLKAEPAEAFGAQAANLIRGARKAPSKLGMSGCVEAVRFVMGPVVKPHRRSDLPLPPPD